MDTLASLSFLPLRFSRNMIAYSLDAASDSLTDRANLVYKLSLLKPAAYGSGEFTELITLLGRELPKYTEFGADVYPGASFDVAVFLDDFLKRTAPQPDQRQIVTCGDMITPFLVQTCIENAGVLIGDSAKTWPLEFALKASLSVDQFAGWQDQFFTTYLPTTRQFLTWQPTEKWVDVAQPEFLYYLVNFTPKPTELWVRTGVTYTDATTEVLTPLKMTAVSQCTVYSIPVGFTALGLADREAATGKTVQSYQVWVSGESAQRLSEVRTYQVNREYEPNELYLLFANSLGGFDTLSCTGQSSRSLTVKGTAAQRALPTDYLPTSAELFSLDRKGDKVLTVNTGLRDGDALDYLSELTLSEEIYVVTQEGLVSLLPSEATFNLQTDDEDLAGRTFAFQHAKKEVGYSQLPQAPVSSSARPTVWVPVNTFCLINENGLRTGYMAAAKLELRYVDDGSLVKPRRSKLNTPGTDGYVAPIESAVCAVTPFVNTLITVTGSYKRNNCGADQESTAATLTIPAGTYGAETADQLQSRIDQAILVMDTQEYANLYGACIANPANYTASIPTGQWQYRSNKPSQIGIYNFQQPWGNSWDRAGGSGPYIYPVGSTALNFPITPDAYYWFFHVYGPANTPFTCKIFRNGTLIYTWSRSFGSTGSEHLGVFNDTNGTNLFYPASGDRIYILLSY